MRRAIYLLGRAIKLILRVIVISTCFIALFVGFYTGWGQFSHEIPPLILLLPCWIVFALVTAWFSLSDEFNWARRSVPTWLNQIVCDLEYQNGIAILGHSWFKWCCGRPMIIMLVTNQSGHENQIRICPRCKQVHSLVYTPGYDDGIRPYPGACHWQILANH
ncbi:MAG: hypothetical protein WCT08_05085 [Patescibacteria group bacterium]